MEDLSAEKFLREKLESQIRSSSHGYDSNGYDSFHTRDIEYLLKCLDSKDQVIRQLEKKCVDLNSKINWNAEKQFNELLEVCMTINNLSAEQRLGYIRKHYKEIWTKICSETKKS